MVYGSRELRIALRYIGWTFALLWLLYLGVGSCGVAYGQSGNSSWDVGGAAGVTSYTGDFNLTALPHQIHGTGGLLMRYAFTEYYSLRAGVDLAGVRGHYDATRSRLPDVSHGVSFSRLVVGVDVAAEIHFLPFEVKDFAPRGKAISDWTPYASLGMGICAVIGGRVAFALPLGCGAKVALGSRFTLAAEVRFVKLFSDGLDGYDNWPEGRGESVFHNKDWIGQVRLALSYRLLTNWSTCPAYKSDNEQAMY